MLSNSDDGSSPFSGDDSASASTDGSPIGPIDGSAGSCATSFPPVTDYGSQGPFDVSIDCSVPTTVTADGTGCAVYHPTTLGQHGLKHRLIVWGNGTAAPAQCNGDAHVCGEYDYLLNQWASQGFIVVAANTNSTGDGKDMLACLDWMEQQNSVSGNPYEGVVDVGNYGVSGHSQGGASAQPVFDAATGPVFWGPLLSADHVTFAGGSQTDWLAPSTAWFRLFFMCDESARPMFYGTSCTLCGDSKWTVERKNL
jgi:hypothetical protein